jgi:ABC-type sugar transport system permease subunit
MKTMKRKFKGEMGELIFYSALIALPLLQIAIFYFYVNFNSFLMAFQKYTFKDGFTWNGWTNFKNIWLDLTGPSSTLLKALGNSAVVWFFTTVVGTFLAIVFAYYIYKKWAFAKTFKFFLFLPSVLPGILLVSVFRFFVDNAIPGYVEVFTGNAIGALLKGDTLFPTVVFYNVWVCFGAQLLIYTGAMDQIAPEIIEAGKVDGVSPIREFFSIVVPMILPTVSTFVIANVATLFTNQANLYAFFGPQVQPSDYTIGYHLFNLVGEGQGMDKYPYASALGILCTLIAFPMTLLARRLLNGKEDA